MRDAIDTNRLSLRRMTAQDGARVATLLNDWDVARMLSRIVHPYTADDFHAWQSGHEQNWAHKRDFPFAVSTSRDGVIGCVGIEGNPETGYELGYWFGRPYWGLGYATEAGAALLAWARADLDPKAFTSRHFEENLASAHVLEKLGFSYTGEVKPSPCKARGHDVASRLMVLADKPREERP